MKVTNEDMDAIAGQHEQNNTQQTNFESLLINSTKGEIEYRIDVIKDFRFKDTRALLNALEMAKIECEKLLNG